MEGIVLENAEIEERLEILMDRIEALERQVKQLRGELDEVKRDLP